ncbi:MAG TPA: ParA family protein [Blastocatellia bacterium]
MKTIVFANNKGGCGKTTCALNVAVALANKGFRVLAVDIDPQGNLSAALGADLNSLDDPEDALYRRTSLRLLLDAQADYSNFLLSARRRLDLIPAVVDDDAKKLLEAYDVSRELLLKEKLAAARNVYDYCVVDTPPDTGAPTLNGLAMSDLTIVPINAGKFGLVGLNQLLRKIAKIRMSSAPNMMVMALSALFVQRELLHQQTRQTVLNKFSDDFVFQTTIPRLAAIEQASSNNKSVMEYEPESQGAFAYLKLVAEIMEVFGDEQQAQSGTGRVSK